MEIRYPDISQMDANDQSMDWPGVWCSRLFGMDMWEGSWEVNGKRGGGYGSAYAVSQFVYVHLGLRFCTSLRGRCCLRLVRLLLF